MLLPERINIGAWRHQFKEVIVHVLVHKITWCPSASDTVVISLWDVANRGRPNTQITASAEAECAAECRNGPSAKAEYFAEGLIGYLAETEDEAEQR